MLLKILNQTPGLLFTILLLAFVIGTFVDSLMEIKQADTQAQQTATPKS
jgi:hypothetical protein